MSAKKDVDAIVSASGMMSEIWWKLVKSIKEKGGSAEDIHRLATPKGDVFIGKMAEVIMGSKAVLPIVKEKADNIFTATVDHSRSLKEMIQAGKYDWVNDDITAKHFPVKGSGKVEVVFELVHFNRSISSDNAIAEIKQKGLRPAKIEELLAFGEKYPEEQRKYPIVALGSVWQNWRGDRRVPCLWSRSVGRGLILYWSGLDWDGGFRFLAVRESLGRSQ